MKKSEGKNLRKYVSFGHFDGLALIGVPTAKGSGLLQFRFARFAKLPEASPRSLQPRYP
jgi:hypothetical protein